MEERDESSLSVLRLFGREPLAEDLRMVGRWSYAAAWLAEDRTTARDLVRARLAGAASAATSAAMAAGRGDADRFALVSAIARLNDAFGEGSGPIAAAAERAVDEEAAQLVADGAKVRAATQRERAAFAPRFGLEGFAAGMLDVAQERHVLLREAASGLNEALLTARGAVPALRTLRLFLQATLALDSYDASAVLEAPPTATQGDPITTLGIWLTADLALTARRSGAYEAAWAAASRVSGDALSRTVAGLTSGAVVSKGVVESLRADPWALLYVLAMTGEPEHASALLDIGVQAQAAVRTEARQAVARWIAQAERVTELEERLGLSVLTSYEAREGFRECEGASSLDLFSAWNVVRTAEEGRKTLLQASEKSVAAETTCRRETVRRAKAALERAREQHEATLDEARGRLQTESVAPGVSPQVEEGAQRGCVFGFGAGCSVIATYAVVGMFRGTDGVIGRIAPLVAAIAAIPMLAGIMAQLALAVRRAAAGAEGTRRRTASTAEFDRLRAAAERSYAAHASQLREELQVAETCLQELERALAAGVKQAA